MPDEEMMTIKAERMTGARNERSILAKILRNPYVGTAGSLVCWELLIALICAVAVATVRAFKFMADDQFPFENLSVAIFLVGAIVVGVVVVGLPRRDLTGERSAPRHQMPVRIAQWMLGGSASVLMVMITISILLAWDGIKLLAADERQLRQCAALDELHEFRLITNIQEMVLRKSEPRDIVMAPSALCAPRRLRRAAVGTVAMIPADPDKAWSDVVGGPPLQMVSRLLSGDSAARKEFEEWCDARIARPCDKAEVFFLRRSRRPGPQSDGVIQIILTGEEVSSSKRLHAPRLYVIVNALESAVMLEGRYPRQPFSWFDLHWLRQPFVPWKGFDAIVLAGAAAVYQPKLSGEYTLKITTVKAETIQARFGNR